MRILKIDSLPNAKQWVDRDHIMLHACFQILQDCVEKEKVDTPIRLHKPHPKPILKEYVRKQVIEELKKEKFI